MKLLSGQIKLPIIFQAHKILVTFISAHKQHVIKRRTEFVSYKNSLENRTAFLHSDSDERTKTLPQAGEKLPLTPCLISVEKS